jgi:hypothetical protein
MSTRSKPRGCSFLVATSILFGCSVDRRGLEAMPEKPSSGVGRYDSGTNGGGDRGDASTGEGSEPPAEDEGADAASGGAGTASPSGHGGSNPDAASSVDPEPEPVATSSDPESRCDFEVTHSLSSEIASVVIVQWSQRGTGLTSAFLEYGTGTDYGMVAPVLPDDLGASVVRTLLLGLPPSSEVHFRIVTESEGGRCRSEDFSQTTGPLANGFPVPTVETRLPDDASRGFIVTSRFIGGGGDNPGQVYIMNAEGQLVWWYSLPVAMLSRARMSYDGRFMWIRDVNLEGGDSRMYQVAMDGLGVETIDLPGSHHDFAVMPDGGIVFIRKTPDTCDEIVRRGPDGEMSVIFEVREAFADLAPATRDLCHTNYVVYDATDGSYTFSELNNDAIVKISEQGELIWVLGGAYSDFEGATWNHRQHGHQMLALDRILLFNNGDMDNGELSLLREYSLDFERMTATETWTYDAGLISTALGDVQRLPNGNTFAVYTTAGVMQEVTPAGEVTREISFPLGEGPGYADFRMSLYGLPLR